jgi:hypothetical protein
MSRGLAQLVSTLDVLNGSAFLHAALKEILPSTLIQPRSSPVSLGYLLKAG